VIKINNKPTVYRNGKFWYWQLYDGNGNRKASSTGLQTCEYSRDEVLQSVYAEFGVTEVPTYSLEWFMSYIMDRLETKGIRESTIQLYRVAIQHLTNIYGDNYHVTNIKKADVFTVQKHLLDKGDRPATVNKVCRHLRSAFERLVDDEIIEKNPFRKFERIIELNDKPTHLEPDELRRFLDIVSQSNNEPGKRLARILVFTGRRRCEILYLKREDIDIANSRMLVENNKHSLKRKKWITIPKEVRSNIAWFLEHYLGQYPLRVCHPVTLSKWIKKWLIEAGCGDLHLHSLRHTFITLAGENGTELWRIQRHVDHNSIRVTEGYFHADLDDGKEVSIGISL